MDARAATDVCGSSVRRSRVVLTPRCWRQVGGRCPAGDGGKRAVNRGEHEVSRKAIAQGRPEFSRCPVCSCALLFAQIARETAGAASTRSSLCPLKFWRAKRRCKPRAQCAARSRSYIHVIAREAKQSNVTSRTERWIASRSLSSGAHSRDPLARKDGRGSCSRNRRARSPDERSDIRGRCWPYPLPVSIPAQIVVRLAIVIDPSL